MKNQYTAATIWIRKFIPKYQGGLTLEEIMERYRNDTPEYLQLGKQEFSPLLHFHGFYKKHKWYVNNEGVGTTKYVYFQDNDLAVEL